jgi:hypothetical protein
MPIAPPYLKVSLPLIGMLVDGKRYTLPDDLPAAGDELRPIRTSISRVKPFSTRLRPVTP